MTFSLASRSKFEKERMNSVLQVKRLNYKIKKICVELHVVHYLNLI